MENLKKSFKDLKWWEWILAVIMIIIAGYAMVKAFIPTGETIGVQNPAWLTVVNFISAIAGVFCIFFCAKGNISNFAFGLVNTVVYIIYLFYWKIYGTACLELFYYLPLNIISWIFWAKHRDEVKTEKTKARKLNWWQNAIVFAVVGGAAVVYHAILVKVGGNVAWLDALTVSIGIIATFLELKRYRDQYTLWLVTDIIAVAMYIVHFDPVYLTKKSIYLIMAFVGWYNWHKLQKENVEDE